MNGPLDLSVYTTAAGAAKGVFRYLRETWGAQHAVIEAPDENPNGNCWAVTWEDGPHDWGVMLTLGRPMRSSGQPYDDDDHPEIVGFYGHQNWLAEPHYGFDLHFTDEP